MPRPLLVIGNKNYSSWSLRPWIAMRVLKLDFQEVRIPLYGPGARQEILRYSPSGKVPCLVDGASRVWDSAAILEYLAEKHPLWPDDPVERAQARSVCAEMHAGFPKLREHMSMNVRTKCRQPFLFGAFGAADAMYAPVVLRFRTYEVELPPACRAYADAVLALPAMREWIEAAQRETEVIPQFDMAE